MDRKWGRETARFRNEAVVRPGRTRRSRFSDRSAPWVLFAPALLFYVAFAILPILGAVGLSFTEASGFGVGELRWAGFGNYAEMLRDDLFWNTLKVTAIFVGASVPLALILGFVSALALDDRSRFVGLVRTSVLIPFSMSLVVVGIFASLFASPSIGLSGVLLPLIGQNPDFMLGTPTGAMSVIVLAHVWIELGFAAFLFLAGLQAIPGELYEAARIDGAGPLQRLRFVTVPMLRETLIVVTVLQVIAAFRVFPLVFVTTNGGPYHSTEVLAMYMYKKAFESFELGYGSAVAVVLALIIGIVTFAQLLVTRAGSTDY